MIPRILLDSMGSISGQFLYHDRPFSGVGFSIDANKVVSSYEIVDGHIIRPYVPICVRDRSEFTEMDVTGMLSDYALVMFDDVPYSGVGYEFFNEFCDREVFLRNGLVESEARWNNNGNLVYFEAPNALFGEMYEWYPTAILKKVAISTNDRFTLSFSFTDRNELSFVSSTRGGLRSLEYISQNARFFPLKHSTEIATMKAASELTLFGSDIEDDFLEMLTRSDVLAFTRTLKLVDTRIASMPAELAQQLEAFYVESSFENLEDGSLPARGFAEQVKLRNPKLRVFVARDEVV